MDIVHAIHVSSVLANFSSEKLGFFYDLKENALEVTRVICRCVLSSCPSYILTFFFWLGLVYSHKTVCRRTRYCNWIGVKPVALNRALMCGEGGGLYGGSVGQCREMWACRPSLRWD